jgi:hypothetical protein
MAANDKITPTSLLIANNLKGTKYSTKNTYKLTPKNTGKYKNVYTDAVDFLASVYAKELKVADFNDLWNFRNADEAPNKAQYTPNKNANYEVLGQIVAFSELEWDELQITISKAFNNIYPFEIESLVGVYTPSEQAYYLGQMGVLDGGQTVTKVLLNAVGVGLGTFNQGVQYAQAWNSLRVPSDAALGFDTPFLAPILQQTPSFPIVPSFFYRYTGKRRWANPFSGYNLY